jgi:hypothetical protein|tara:strand:- start:468 stop:1538 length:1071 start_codon:yes stop_codon:yes gene_type:complete
MDKITEADFKELNVPEAETPLDFASVKLKEHQTKLEKAEEKRKAQIAQEEKERMVAKRVESSTPTKEVMLKGMSDIDVMSMNLKTSEVKTIVPNLSNLTDKQLTKVRTQNIDNYSKQIKTNILVGVKAIFLVCRDLVEAERNLYTEDFEMLKETLPLSDATISKYTTIGKSKLCSQLFQIGRMPDSWTTMYKIASVKDSDKQKKLLEEVNIDTTAEVVDVIIDKAPKGDGGEKEATWIYSQLDKPKDFLKIAFENNKAFADVDPNTLLLIKNRVQAVVIDSLDEMKIDNLNYYVSDKAQDVKVEVVVNETLFEKITDKVLNFFTKKMKGTVASDYAKNFLNKQKEVEGHLPTPLDA